MASLLDLDTEASYSLTRTSRQNSPNDISSWSPSSEKLEVPSRARMASNRNRFLSGSDRELNEATPTPILPMRQPLAPYIEHQGFPTRSSFQSSHRSFPNYTHDESQIPPGLASYNTSHEGLSFPPGLSFSNRSVPFMGDPRAPAGIPDQNLSIYISDELLDLNYSFALCRGNGVYTRLIPADRLPPMKDLPQTQGPEGLIVLPSPRASSPGNRGGFFSNNYFHPVPSAIGDGRPGTTRSLVSTDPIQKQIDNIVTTAPSAPAKKTKIYCDKWLHDGTCAFTQQGCRYKHEMPLDRETQMDVGLFNGIPMWYRRAQAVELRSTGSIMASPRVLNGSQMNTVRDLNNAFRPNPTFDTNMGLPNWRNNPPPGRLSYSTAGSPTDPIGSPINPRGRNQWTRPPMAPPPAMFNPRSSSGMYENRSMPPPPMANNTAANTSYNRFNLLNGYGEEEQRR